MCVFRGETLRKYEYISLKCRTCKDKNKRLRTKNSYLISDTFGIKFLFVQRELEGAKEKWSKQKLASIFVDQAVETSDGIKVGTSKIEDVLKVYEKPEDYGEIYNYFILKDKGIAFRFDDDGIVTEVHIFKVGSIK